MNLFEEYKVYHSNVLINPIERLFFVLIKYAGNWERTRKLMYWNYKLHMEYMKWDKYSKSWKKEN